MPYIRRVERFDLDKLVDDAIAAEILETGRLNYFLFKLARTTRPSYANYRNLLGELSEASAEIRRRIVAPYEDKKITENGDVG